MNNSGVRSSGSTGSPAGRAVGTGASARGDSRVRRLLARAAAAGVLSLGVWGAAGGCSPETPIFDPRTMDRAMRDTAGDAERLRRATAAATTRPATLPTTLQTTTTDLPASLGPVPSNMPIVRLPLQEIIQRAAAHNKESRVAGYEPSIEETRTIENEARFDPSFFLNGSYEVQRVLQPVGGQSPDIFQPREFRTLSGQAGVRQLLPTGAQSEISYREQRIQANTPFTGPNNLTFQQYYLNELLLKLTQPLLRDFGSEVNRARITISQNNRRISLLDFRKTLEDQLFQTEQAYWQLVQAEREVAIQEGLLERSLETYRVLYSRFIAGVDVSRVQVSQASSFVEAQRAVLLRAKSRVSDLSDLLKGFMNDPDFPVAGPVVILPADGPIEEPIDFDLSDLIDAALDNRFELGQQLLRIRTAELTQGVARNNLLPQLNFIGSLSVQGVGLNPGQAVKDQRQWDNLSSSIALELEIPIGNRAARAIFRRVELQRLQSIEQYQGLIDQVTAEVTTSLRDVNTSWEEIVQRRQARFAAQDSLLAIRERREAGEALTPEFVQLELDAQERLARAAAEESAALANYNIAISRLERAKGTLLRYNNVVMAEEPLPRQ
jgi:outer membrane protein TolC